MGGLAGIALRDPARPPDPAALAAMGEALRHRGPGDAGAHLAPGIGLVGRTAPAADPHPSGRLPAASEDGRVQVVVDGSIDNHVELRDDLRRRGVRLPAAGDAGVLLRLYLQEGIEAVHRLAGAFAFAIWDGRRPGLWLGRDRLGVRPLAYRVAADGLRFASEVRGLLAEPGPAPAPDPEAIHQLLTLRYVPQPRTAWAGLRVLPPAHLLLYERGEARLRRYWSIPEAPPDAGPAAAQAERLRALMDEAVRVRLRGDAPAALLLTGGLDAAVVAHHMRRNLSRSFRAFAFPPGGRDDDGHGRAREVAARYGADLAILEAGPYAPLDVLESALAHLRLPFADPALVPAWLLARALARHARVALTGDGADEAFGGHDRYRAHLLADRFGWLPGLISKSPFFALLEAVSSEKSRRSLPGRLRRFLEGWELPARERDLLWMANPGARRIARLYRPEFAAAVAGADPTAASGTLPNGWGDPALVPALLRSDLERHLPDDLLFRADATAMAFGIELRSPFLDHRVVEFAAAVPAARKVRLATGAWILRQAYRGRIPDRVLRARGGVPGAPIGGAFPGPIGGAAHDLLLSPGARSRDLLNREAVAAVLKIHRSGQRNYDELIWTLVVLEIWLRQSGAAPAREAA